MFFKISESVLPLSLDLLIMPSTSFIILSYPSRNVSESSVLTDALSFDFSRPLIISSLDTPPLLNVIFMAASDIPCALASLINLDILSPSSYLGILADSASLGLNFLLTAIPPNKSANETFINSSNVNVSIKSASKSLNEVNFSLMYLNTAFIQDLN